MTNFNLITFTSRMILFIIVFVAFALDDCHVAGNTTVAIAKEECRKRIAQCSISNGANTPVCGSDGVTYSSQCEVVSKQCRGGEILIKHTGPCLATSPCSAERIARPGVPIVCRPDGNYAPVQCHTETGYCWCVTPQGRPLPNTTVKYRRPKCAKVDVITTLSSSSSSSSSSSISNNDDAVAVATGQRRRSPVVKQRRQFTSRHRNTCDRAEKSKFNSNLIENFKIEYRRTNISSDGDKNVDRVLSWKFMTLDKDGDGHLDRTEYKELRRLAKKAVRPKKCARTFARTCDLNQDLKLSRQEWGSCLANDFTPFKGHPSPVYIRPTFNDDPPDTKEESDANDCISDRRSVMEDQKQNSQEKFYIPQCTPDGRYHEVQCYSGYCFCVYQDTGKPIPGTSSKDHTPNCNPVPPPSRPMKGCPEAKKQPFLRDLMDLMEKKMKTSSTDSVEVTEKWPASKEERVATWHFVMLDKNKNKVLERKEWKSFRTMVANNRLLRRCGKKLPRYCDINNDRRISMTEWLSCLNAQRPSPAETVEKTSTSKPRRMGPNPLDTFLNDDD